jgi:hypothetical protein
MPFTLRQPRGSFSGTSLTYNSALGAGTLLVAYIVSNSGTPPTVTSGSQTLTSAVYTAGHNGDWTGIFYLPPDGNPGGQTTLSAPTIYALGYAEFTGCQYHSPLVNTSVGGNAVAGTSVTCTSPAGAAQMQTYICAYDVTNSGTAIADGYPTPPAPFIVSNFGQTGWTPAKTDPSFSIASGTYDICMANFLGASGGQYQTQRTMMQGPG